MPPTVSVTIVLHNSADHLEECLSAIASEVDEGFAELIAVDNASPDDSADLLQRSVPRARLIRAHENLGFAAGVNLTWPSVQGRYWMLLNPDVALDAGGLRALAGWMESHPEVGAASAELTDQDGRGPSRTGRAFPSAWRALLEASRLHLLIPRRLRGRILRGAYWRGGDQVDAGWVPATALMVRRESVEQVGVLDERFFLYGEDIEWCWRIRRAGWSIGVCSAVRARHREASSTARTFDADDSRRRMIRGEVEAVRKARGARYAHRYARAVAFGLRLESLHPGRAPQLRKRAGAAARAWRRAAREGPT